MTSDAIRSRLDSNPFVPLRVRTKRGSEYRVTLPGQLSLFGPEKHQSLMFNHKTVEGIPLDLIQSIEPESVPADYTAGSSNGSGVAMTIEKFDEFLKRQPFVPFTVHVADGGSFEVKGPEFASRTHNGRTIFISTQDERTEWIDLLLVTRISSGVNNPAVSSR
ncbi:MAG: hypothetical protein WBD40_13140 [Tepidisphaeraceae bacterium]